MHVLIIEDEPLIALTIEDELRACGYATADNAVSQEEAIQMAQATCPDLITVDERLASGSGIAAIRIICRDRPIPVLWITGIASDVLQAVPDAVVLEKPFSHRNLCLAIPQAIDAARIHR